MLSFLLFGACGDISTSSKNNAENTSSDTALVDSAEAEITLDDYVEIYCEALGVGCGIYPTMEECRSDLNAQWFDDCEVVDTDALEVCAEWISNLECNEEGWITECDDSFECQF